MKLFISRFDSWPGSNEPLANARVHRFAIKLDKLEAGIYWNEVTSISQTTKHYAPFDLIHYEAYRNEKDAKRREEYFKTTKGRTTLKTMLKEFIKVNQLKT